MYCINCGVELADSETVCPLCGTRVFHPDMPRQQGEPPFPPDPMGHPEEVNRSGVLFILTMLAVLPIVICILCDWSVNGAILWSGYAAGGVALLYILAVLPLWFRRPNPVIFVPADFAAIGLYLLYINFATGGHWFLTFALPVTGTIGVLVTTVVTLLRYLSRGHLYIFGGALIAGGGLAVLIEFLLNLTFGLHHTFIWSFYPLAAGVLLGAIGSGVCSISFKILSIEYPSRTRPYFPNDASVIFCISMILVPPYLNALRGIFESMSEGVSLPKRFAISCTFNITRFCSFFDQILIQCMALFCLFRNSAGMIPYFL